MYSFDIEHLTGKEAIELVKHNMTEKEKKLAGEVYSAVDPELIEELMAAREVLYE